MIHRATVPILLACLAVPVWAQDEARVELVLELIRGNDCVVIEGEAREVFAPAGLTNEEFLEIIPVMLARDWIKGGAESLTEGVLRLTDEACAG